MRLSDISQVSIDKKMKEKAFLIQHLEIMDKGVGGKVSCLTRELIWPGGHEIIT